MRMARRSATRPSAADYVKAKRKNREPVTGFGHRVYRAEDPRARHMRDGVQRLSREMGEPQWYEILQAVVAAMQPYARHGVNVNVDFYSGVVYLPARHPEPTSSCRSSPSAGCRAGPCRCWSSSTTTS